MARHWQVLLVVTAGAFLANLDLFIVNVAFPAIQADFGGADLSALSWVLNGYAIVFAALLVPAGRLADLVGRKRVFLGGLALFLAASVACGVAPGPWALVAARVVQAVGAALMIPTSLALLLPEFPPNRRAAAVGLWTAGAAVAATVGPTIGGLLVTASWRWVFLINLPLGLLTGLAGARVLRESRDPARGRRPDLLGAALLCVGVGALALGVVKGGDWGWASPAFVAAEAAAAAALAGVAVRSTRHPAPVVEPALLRPRATRAADASVFLFSMAFFPLLLASVLFMTEVWGYSALEAGLAIAPGPLMVALLSWPAGSLAGRLGPRRLVRARGDRLRGRLRLVDRPRRHDPRLPRGHAALDDPGRRRRRADLPGARRDGGLRPAARAHGHRQRPVQHGAPDRGRGGDRGLRRDPRLGRPRPRRLPGGLGVHGRVRAGGGGGAGAAARAGGSAQHPGAHGRRAYPQSKCCRTR